MWEEELIRMWREELRVPPNLTELQVMVFWSAEDKPYLDRVGTVKEYGRKFNIRSLIETGTYHGDMIQATLSDFDHITSIELEQRLYEAAKSRFAQYAHVSIVHGDSGKVLPSILRTISEPCLFWLDGHYNPFTTETARGDRDTPILQELTHILNHEIRNHVILIDDARCFIGPNPVLQDFPSIKDLKDFIARIRPDIVVEVRDDIIRVYPS